MRDQIDIQRNSTFSGSVGSLPSSKSLSNRALIINALTNNRGEVDNLSTARDTELMKALLATPNHVIDVMDAGTTMRFLTAYFSITNQQRRMTGSARMQERPLAPLVEALRTIGVTIEYTGKDGYPPIEIKGFSHQLTDKVAMQADVSSQFISALMMTAPMLPSGLTIELKGKTASLPYLLMTADLMERFGIKALVSKNKIVVPAGKYKPATYRVEPDWSAASYWFAFVALAEKAEVLLPGVRSDAVQGDRVIVDIMDRLGVKADFQNDGLRLTGKSDAAKSFKWDFADCPDLAQTVLPVCAARNIPGEFTGLESLRIKETDRIEALQAELEKIGARLTEHNATWTLESGRLPLKKPFFHTYHDHRMAMGFAPLATRMDISIENPGVVRKSYPTFWEDMKGVGFKIQS